MERGTGEALFNKYLFKDFIYLLLERQEGSEKERERNMKEVH